MNALQPVVTALLQSPLSILTQTPPADTYNNATVISWWTSFLAVADLACFVVIGGYNVMVGRYLGLRHSELVEFLPRLLLAFGAASFSLYFLGLFIDPENALCAVSINLAGTSILTNIILALFHRQTPGVERNYPQEHPLITLLPGSRQFPHVERESGLFFLLCVRFISVTVVLEKAVMLIAFWSICMLYCSILGNSG